MYLNTSYAKGPVSSPLLYETIGERLKKTTSLYPTHDALICLHQNYRSNYAEFFNQTTQIAKSLIALGLCNGMRIGIWSPNRYEWTLLQFASARIGVILVNLNPAYGSSEVTFVLNQSEINTVFAPVSFKTSQYKNILCTISNETPSVKNLIFFEENWTNFLDLSSSIADQILHDREKSVKTYDAVNIQYTSGTTGFPKGVTLTHHNILNNGYFIGNKLNYNQNDRVCIPVPFYHCFGMVIGNLCCVAHGACMVIPNDSFSPELTLKAVEQESCTSLYGVPTMFITELELPNFNNFDLSSLRTGVMAGSPCPIEVMKKVKSLMNMEEISICYGMTETSPVSTQTIIGDSLEKQVTTVGTVHDHLEIKIINPDTGQITEIGEPGEFCTKGYSVMLKYWNDQVATLKVIDKEGWLHTGDLATMDSEGYVKIIGRIKDVIIRGGENISPKEIEDFLYRHESVSDIQIVGVPSEKYGEEIMAWIKLKDGATTTEQELTNYCKQIAHFKRPKYWKFVREFPTTVSGKIKKNEIREISTNELGLEHLLKN